MKTSLIHRLLITLIGAAISFSPSAFGHDTTDMLSKALDLVHQVENPASNPLTDAQRIDLLTQAITMAQQAPNHRLKGHRVLAIQAIRGAIAEIKGGDPNHQASIYLHTADTELSTSVSLASSADTPEIGAPSPATTTTTSSTALAAMPTPAPLTPVDMTALGITPEMEQTFLAKYKAALEKQDADALFSLVAVDPNMDAKAKEDLKGLFMFGFAMDTSNPNRTYSFVPITPGQEDKPSEIDGKMYGDYLPTVVALKITFAKPAHPSPDGGEAVGDSIMPLGIKDHQLMFVGAKEIPGAVPPPAVDKAANFGIEPNLRKLSDKAKSEGEDGFTSLQEFLASLKQPNVEILASGETKYEYYGICRIAPNLCVWAGGDKVGEGNYSFYFRATDSNKQELKGPQKWIRLVDVPTDNGQAPNVQGTVFFVPDHYTGPITIDPHYSDDAGNKISSVSRTIDWK